MPNTRRFTALMAVLVVVILSVGVESSVRLAEAVSPALRSDLRHYDVLSMKVEPHATAGYRPKPDTRWRYPNGAVAHVNAQGFRGPVVAPAKAEGVTRVVLLGGSTSFGWGVNDAETIDVALRAHLATRLPGRPVEVINAAFDGYDTFQLLERMRSDVVRLRPDVVILNVGINDVRGAEFRNIIDADPRTMLWREPMAHARDLVARGAPRLVDRVQHWVHAARLAALVRDRLKREAIEESMPRAVHWDAADHFERNVRRLAAIAERHGAAVVLSTPPSALRERHRPTETSSISYWSIDAGTTAMYRDTLAMRLARIAEDGRARGAAIVWVRPVVPPADFLDDAHLTAAGNVKVAEALADASIPLLARRTAAEVD